jgi:hypothetical protein
VCRSVTTVEIVGGLRGVIARLLPRSNGRAFLAGAATAGGLPAAPVPVGASHVDVTLGRNRTFYETDVGYPQPSASGEG